MSVLFQSAGINMSRHDRCSYGFALQNQHFLWQGLI